MRYIILLIVFLAGCSNTFQPEHFTKANSLCEQNGGLSKITSAYVSCPRGERCIDGNTTYFAEFFCKNGDYFNIRWMKR